MPQIFNKPLSSEIEDKLNVNQGQANAGKFMKVGNDGSLAPDNIPTELPAVTSSDNGKVLGVSSGEWEAVAAPSGLPAVTSSDNGKVLTVSSGAWSAQEASGGAPTTLSVTLASGSWSSAAPPTQTVTATGVTSSNTVIVGLADNATTEQLESARDGGIRGTGQAADSLTFTAYGDTPEVNIPVSVVIMP